jgi:hypothetical protein
MLEVLEDLPSVAITLLYPYGILYLRGRLIHSFPVSTSTAPYSIFLESAK